VDSLTTQIDIAPTVLGLLGLPYKAPFFGQNALRAAALPRVAVFSHNNDVALYRDGEMVILGLHRGAESYRYDPATDRYADAPPNPALEQLAIAYFQVAFDLFRDHRYE
jgi:phosphoglycerol transferase MdoB-like AlkP superfamily enzyme